MELEFPLLYGLYPALNIFHVFWGEHWDSMPGNFKQADIEAAMKAILGTPYFDNLCQYGIPGFTFEGKATSDGAGAALCGKNPGSEVSPGNFEVSTLGIFEWMLCEENLSPLTGVPFAFGLPNPLCGPELARV
jgi:hypothetical protein